MATLKSFSAWLRRTFQGEASVRAWEKLRSMPQPERVIVFVSYVRPGGPREVCSLEQSGSGAAVTVERSLPGRDPRIERNSWNVTCSAAENLWHELERLGWSSLRDCNAGFRDGNRYEMVAGTSRSLKRLTVLNPPVGTPHALLVQTLEAFFHRPNVETR